MLRTARSRVLLLVAACVGGAAAAVLSALFTAGDAGAAPTCTIYWTGATNTAWSTASNWSLSDGGPSAGGVPGAGDYVCMSTAPTRSSVISSASNRTINGINFAKTATVTPSLEIQGATFTANTNPSTINNLTIDAGTLTGSAAVTLTGNAAVPSSSVTLGGTGVKTIGTGATFAQSATLTVGGTASGQATQVVNNGNYTLGSSTTLYLSTQASATASSFTNAGTLTMTDGSSLYENGTGAKHPSFLNSGTLTNLAATSSGNVYVNFTNTGTVSVGGTDLSFNNTNATGTTDTGTWDTSGAGHLILSADRSITAGSITGASGVQQTSGTVTYGASVTVSKLDLEGGTVSGSPTVTTLIGNSGTFSGAGTLTATGSGSSLCSTTIANGYTLVNSGTVSYVRDCGYVSFTTGGVLKNTGTLAITGTGCCGSFSDDGNAANAVLNSGTLTLNLDANTSNVTLAVPFTNTGTVTVTTGQLGLQDGNAASSGTDTGTYSIASSALVTVSGGTRTFASGTVTGSGVLQIAGGTVTLSSGVTVSNLDLEGGTISGSPSVVNLTFNGGTLTGSGTMTTTGAASTICNAVIDSGYTLNNSGTIGYKRDCGYLFLSNGASLTNSGTIAVTGSGCCGYIYDDGNAADGFLNTGSVTVALDANTSSLSIDTPFTNNGTVTTTTGQLNLGDGNTAANPNDTGTYAISSGAVVDFSAGTRSVNAGTVTGAGTLEAGGASVTFASGVSISNLDVEGGTVSGSPSVGNVSLDGGALDGAGTMTITGTGSTLCNVTMSNGYTLINQGTLTYTRDCGYAYLANASVIKNLGTLAVTGSGCCGYVYDDGNPGSALLNAGTLTLGLDANTSTLSVSTPFTNTGAVTVTKGQLVLNYGNAASSTSDTGTYSIASGATVQANGGARTLSSGSVSGAGKLIAAGASPLTFATGYPVSNLDTEGGTVSGSPTVANATLNGGTLDGAGTLTATGTSTLCGPTLTNGYRILNQGTMSYALSGCYVPLSGGSSVENAGTLNYSGSGGYIYDDGSAGNGLRNDASGTINVALSASSTEEAFTTPFTNNGTLSVTKGKFTPNSGITNLSGGTLTGGTWIANGGTITFPNAVTNNAATLVLGTTGAFSPGLTTLATNSGSVTVSQNLTESVALTNSGTVTDAAGTWRVNSFTQSAGALVVQSGATFKSGASGTAAVAINGGTLSGTGTVQGAVAGAGTVSPGTANAGTLTVTGTYTEPSAGSLAVTPTGTQLATSGAVSLAGTLAITPPSSLPAVGTVTTIVTGGSITGTFATVTGQDVPSLNAYWQVKYTATTVTLALTPYPTASVANVSQNEGNSGTTSQTFTVNLSAPSQQSITLNYATADGTATAGSDYTSTSGTLTFTPGQTSKSVTVLVNGDTVYEHDETYSLTLSAPVHVTVPGGPATGTILNDDTAPVVSIAGAGTTVSASSGGTLSFPVTLSTVSGVDAKVSYATSDGTAVAGTDYTATSGTLTIPAGSTAGTVTVTAPAQTGYAAPKTFTVTLSAPVDAALGTSTATGTITNNNAAITSVTPSTLFRQTSTAVTISGNNFAAGSTVTVSGNGVGVSNVVVVDAQTITAKLLPNATAATGNRSVVVASPGHGTATCVDCVKVRAKPAVTSVAPSTLPRNAASATTLTITGSNFVAGAKVSFIPANGMVITSGSTHVINATTITVAVKAKQYAALGAYNVRVTNLDTGLGTCTGCLTVTGPTITSASPTTVPRGQATPITINGAGFDPAATVSVGCALSGTTVNPTSITTTVTCSNGANLGYHQLIVTNPDGSTYKCNNCVSVFGPNITSLSPSSVTRGVATSVTFTGSGFVAGSTITATSCTFTNIVVSNPHTLTATVTCVANAAPGARQVTITDPASSGSAMGSYSGFTITA